ncbi:Transmembrane protein 53 [Caenorhabditis elegans]|uniref:Transmembrane protein 53 n=1 Tax=Caenorhabditis elegans TaxID=6239 RepID=Q9TZH8_CAEEL|nr:Transmembrane protein 53 [Caenorhabditis elegans]CCD66244.1 Transmembrane protein 53 [Caenorhabditis elegans]|eukprot:NP_491980.1 Uncharacterized protein CELE_T10B11.6 [Caenorhabditis elegans]
MFASRRLLPKIAKSTSSTSSAVISTCIQKRNYFTRHVPEPKMMIHLSKSQDVTVDSIVLSDSHHDEKKPVILMVGWAGANPKHIDKYIKVYNDEGYRVVSLCPPCYHYSIPNSRVGFYMSPLFRAIDAKPGDFRSFAKCPIIVHSFSMNGVRGLISFWKWTEAEEKPQLRERIKGIIFDSAPSRPYGKQDATAMVISTPPIDAFERWISEQTRISVLTWFLNLRAYLQIPLLTMVPFLRSFVSIYYYLQTHIALPRDQLYLYSKADTMIKAKHVEKFIEKQKEKGNSVTAIDFVDSEHVAHIRTHPKDYRTACLNFVRHVEASYK